MEHEEITEKIIGCFYEVYNTVGFGFLENVYSNALAVEFERVGLNFAKEFPIGVFYKGEDVGNYFADFLVEGNVIVEVKAVSCLCGKNEAQVINYLKGTGKRVGLLVNFGGDSLDFKRKAFGAKD